MKCIGCLIIVMPILTIKQVVQCSRQKGQWLSKTKREEKEVNNMSQTFAILTLFELLVGALLVYGFMHEDKVVKFEKAVKRIVVGHYRRFKRKMLQRILDRKVMKLYDQL